MAHQATLCVDPGRDCAPGVEGDSGACPVCATDALCTYARFPAREYWQCRVCEAISLTPSQRLDRKAEAAYYRLHRNNADDPGYRRFLSRLSEPLLQRLPVGAEGLDFGCGPGPALPEMLRAAGMRVMQFDPLFFPDHNLLEQRYDFITCSEVVEHFHQPAQAFALLFSLLRPGGMLAVMTGFPPVAGRFADWHYRRDPTHVVFYAPATLAWLGERHDADCEIPCANVALLRKRG